jgi:mRNA interferase MazF
MTACSRGDVVLVRFPFPDGTGVKRRPAVVVSSTPYHRSRQEVVVAAVTSNVRRRLLGDHLIKDWKRAGLLFPSVVTGILRTVKQTMVERRLGALPEEDLEAVERELRRSLGL